MISTENKVSNSVKCEQVSELQQAELSIDGLLNAPKTYNLAATTKAIKYYFIARASLLIPLTDFSQVSSQ